MSPFSLQTRAAGPNDLAYIASTWIRGFKSKVPSHRLLVNALLARSSAAVAHPEGDPETILGFIVWETDIVHWLYVRAAWRSNGIARALMGAAGLCDPRSSPLVFTHWGDATPTLLRRFKALVYYPYAAQR